MKTPQLLLTGLIALAATLMFSQTLPSTFPSMPPKYAGGPEFPPPQTWYFQLGGKHYSTRITRRFIDAGPDWSPSLPLPLSMTKAEEIARAQLRKLGTDDLGWEVTDLSLKRLSPDYRLKWFYMVRLEPTVGTSNSPSDSFLVAINLSGDVGVIE
jgi:hypothetical protein